MEEYRHDPFGDSSSAPTLYSVGHGSRTAAEFLEMLRAAAIDGIADVRAYPASRRHPQFVQETLASILDKAGIAYWWLGKALGGFRRGTSSSIHTALAGDSLRAYAEHMHTAAFQQGIADLMSCASQETTAILCAERLPRYCHRALISDYLTVNGIAVVHVLESGHQIPHRVNRLARWEQGQLIYDQGGGQLGWKF